MKQVIRELEKLRYYLFKYVPVDNDTILLTERQRDYIIELIDRVLGDDKDEK